MAWGRARLAAVAAMTAAALATGRPGWAVLAVAAAADWAGEARARSRSRALREARRG